MIAVNHTILKEYLKYQKNSNDFDRELILKFFHYYKPFVVSITQLIEIGYDKKTALTLYKNRAIFNALSSRIVSANSESALISETKYKLMLTHNSDNYPYLNIFNDKVDKNYTATYEAGERRDKIKAHIKMLLADARYINIVDGYLYDNWDENLGFLKEILPNNRSIVLYCKFENRLTPHDKQKFKKLKEVRPRVKNYTRRDMNESGIDIRNIHDRYIITDKIKIILSGGINYMVDTSKDFTYIVKEK